MSVELLRQAAAKMRVRAYNAALSPWAQNPNPKAWSVFSETLQQRGDVADEVANCLDHHDAEHIASWHPTVALAVADWLEVTAADIGTSTLTFKAAEQLAHAYLGTKPAGDEEAGA